MLGSATIVSPAAASLFADVSNVRATGGWILKSRSSRKYPILRPAGSELATSVRHGNGMADASQFHGLVAITFWRKKERSSYEFARGPATDGKPGDPRLEQNACPPEGIR